MSGELRYTKEHLAVLGASFSHQAREHRVIYLTVHSNELKPAACGIIGLQHFPLASTCPPKEG